MRNILYIIIIILLSSTTLIAAEQPKIIVEGFGTTFDDALNDAQCNAVKQVCGITIASETVVNNYELQKDQILTNADIYVKNYKLLNQNEDASGAWVVKIAAVVDSIMDNLVRDQMAVELLLSDIDKPCIAVIINEQERTSNGSLQDSDGIYLSNKVIEILLDYGFPIVEQNQIAFRLQQDATGQAALQGDLVAANTIALDLGAELLLQGTAITKINETIFYGETIETIHASITGRMYKTDTAEIISATTLTEKGGLISDATTASGKILGSIGEKLAMKTIAMVIQKWGAESANTSIVELVVTGANLLELRELKNKLTLINGVNYIDFKSVANNLATIDIEYKGTGATLAEELSTITSEKFALEVTSFTANKIGCIMNSK